MIPRRFALYLLPLFGLLASPPAGAGDPAHEWLMKMSRAARTLDYDGIFVYQHDTRLEAMRILHRLEKGGPQERLVALNGAAREIIRNEREVLCYLPDENSVVVEQRKADGKNFPSLVPEQLQNLDENYQIQLGKTGRIAGRTAQLVVIRPRDEYRYGYQLWADTKTGLLLKADLLDVQDKILEQVMFVQVAIGVPIPAAALKPGITGEGYTWHRRDDAPPAPGAQNWAATRLPKGFKLTTRMVRISPVRKRPVEHLVYSDGLAAVSVFIEKLEKDAKAGVQGASRMGAVHAFGARANEHHVTAVGEVPAATAALIGGSVAPSGE